MSELRPTSRSGLMSDEDRKLVDIFMAANATPQGRMFSEALLAGIKAVIAADRAAANAPASEKQTLKGASLEELEQANALPSSDLAPVDDATAEKLERAVAALHGNKGPYSYESMPAQGGGTVYRIRDANDNALGRSYVEHNAKLIVDALNAPESESRALELPANLKATMLASLNLADDPNQQSMIRWSIDTLDRWVSEVRADRGAS